MNDRWERARRLGWGAESSVYDSVLVIEPVSVGEMTWIGPWVLLDGSGGGVAIGSGCNISAGAHLYTHDTVRRVLSGGECDRKVGAIKVGDRTYIGPHSVVSAGVTIGSMCVIGANSLVNRDVPDRSIAVGSPARIVGRVEGDGREVRTVFD